jgi:hypothetical protein
VDPTATISSLCGQTTDLPKNEGRIVVLVAGFGHLLVFAEVIKCGQIFRLRLVVPGRGGGGKGYFRDSCRQGQKIIGRGQQSFQGNSRQGQDITHDKWENCWYGKGNLSMNHQSGEINLSVTQQVGKRNSLSRGKEYFIAN